MVQAVDSPIAASRLETRIMSPAIGVEVAGVDLTQPLEDTQVQELRALLLKHQLLVFRDQPLNAAQHVAFARRFGELEVHPVFPHDPGYPELVLLGGNNTQPGRENIYHSDVSWRAEPSMGSILRCIECPPAGGDTIWCNMALAYENLPPHIKDILHELEAVHDLLPGFIDRIPEQDRAALRDRFPAQTHPVVRTHPETGQRILYVSSWTTHLANYIETGFFRGMPELQSGAHFLLQYLVDQARHPEYQVRLKWQPHTIAFWDNRATQHYAVQDYFPLPRQMARATIVGDRPY